MAIAANILHRFSAFPIVIALIGCTTSCGNKDQLLSRVPSSSSGITFKNILPEKEQLNILYHINYYNGGGVSVADFNKDGLSDIYFSSNSKGANKLYLNKGKLTFEDITTSAGVAGTADWCGGTTITDINGDGYPDIYVVAVSGKLGLTGRNQLFINNRNNTFTESAAQYGLDLQVLGQHSAFFDYDRDGDLDCFLLNQSDRPFSYIVDTSHRRAYDSLSGDRLLRNDISTAGRFTDVSKQAGIWQSKLGYGLGLGIADLNNDGWDDIYVSNDFHENDYYYINNGDGTFTDAGRKHFRHFSRFSMGNDIADYNNDGQLDVVTVDMLPAEEKILKTYGSDEQFDIYRQKITYNGFQPQFSKNCLQRNNGNGESFSEVSLISGVSASDWSWCPLFTDLDNDGNKDLFITSGIPKRPVDLDYVRFISDLAVKKQMDKSQSLDKQALDRIPDGASYSFVFQGSENGIFTEKSEEWGTKEDRGYFNGAAWADLDNDGDVDMIVNAINSEAIVYRNNTKDKSYLTLQPEGPVQNQAGIGMKAWLFAGNKVQYQQLMLTRGFESSSEPRLHFGLNEWKNVDSLLVVWPDQKFQLIKNIAVNKQVPVKYSDAAGTFVHASFFPPEPTLFEDITSAVSPQWKHTENEFVDFNTQYLIPHQLSTRGPKIAVADVNGDGLDDFYVCGSLAQNGALMIQTADGKFRSHDTAVLNKSNPNEEVDALFFDANKDGAMDLYIVSGGNEFENNSTALNDRLFINDGKGNFRPGDRLPQTPSNKSTVSAADVDRDGDNDLFVGGLANAKAYGIPQDSWLLINDGSGKFSIAEESQINLAELGMVTSSAFADINKDGWTDLIVTGEWMPVKVFLNNNGKFKASDITSSTGLWQTIYVTDINGDGHTDILAGNWGHNCKLYAGKNGPVKLFVKDFDGNGSIEQIMAYTIDGKEYPFLAKDELERPLPTLKKGYLTYSEVAGKTVDYILYNLFKDYSELKAETLSSSCFVNDGKGNFTRIVLPNELQLAPLMAFAPLNNQTNSFIAAGNFFGVIPYEGRYDAMIPTAFSYDGKMFNQVLKLPAIDGEVRDAKWLNYSGGRKLLVLARNNDSLRFLIRK